MIHIHKTKLLNCQHSQCKMTSLNVLPTEIIQNIIMNIPRRPFKTELLLLNKTLCSLFMAEQVRNLKLNIRSIHPWITTITSNDIKMPYSELRYYSLLNKVVILDIVAANGKLSEETIARFIACCVNLHSLILECATILEYGALIFNNLPSNIVEITFRGLSILNENGGVRSLVNYTNRNIKLEVLYFERVRIDEEGVAIWKELLKPNSAIKQLHIDYCLIKNKGAHALAEALKLNTTLISLRLLWNGVGVEGTHALLEALKQNTALINLSLVGNTIDTEGAHVLAEALKRNTVLTSLALFNNQINSEGAYALVEALKQNTTLTYLNLRANRIDDEDIQALTEILKQNANLTVLM